MVRANSLTKTHGALCLEQNPISETHLDHAMPVIGAAAFMEAASRWALDLVEDQLDLADRLARNPGAARLGPISARAIGRRLRRGLPQARARGLWLGSTRQALRIA